jgi:hypothetical protein
VTGGRAKAAASAAVFACILLLYAAALAIMHRRDFDGNWFAWAGMQAAASVAIHGAFGSNGRIYRFTVCAAWALCTLSALAYSRFLAPRGFFGWKFTFAVLFVYGIVPLMLVSLASALVWKKRP